MYHPQLGRWIQNDPIDFESGDPNLVRYVGNNPVNRLDPSGLIAIGAITGGAGLAALPFVQVTEVAEPTTASFGAFVWPVKFELSKKSDKACGGFIIQRVTKSIQILFPPAVAMNKPKPYEDYWEAWRVEPDSTSPIPISLPKEEIKKLTDAKINIDDNIKATDWFASTGYTFKGRTVLIRYVGELYYVDGIKSLPAGWGRNVPQAGDLPSVYNTPANEQAVRNWLSTSKAIGPTPHSITVRLITDGTTKVIDKTP